MFIKFFLLLLAASLLSAGRLPPQPETRIVNGETVDIERAPWQVALRFNGKPHCGGSIYSERIIITAAHCLYNDGTLTPLKAENFEVLAGSANKLSSETIVKVAAIKLHQDYIDFKKGYDIGIVKLSRPLDLTTPKMQKIALAVENPAPGTRAMATGWGALYKKYIITNETLETKIKYPDILQAVFVDIQSCKNLFHDATPDLICAGSPQFTTCKGDSGGPLVVGKTLVGVVSYGNDICTSGSAYASVSHFRRWIEEAAKSI